MKENRKLLREVLQDIRRDMTDEEVLNLLADSKISVGPDTEKSKYTLGQRAADAIAKFAGSWAFIFSFTGVLILWMVVNVLLAARAFDPYPFILLNLVLSCVAAIQAPLIMMSQNRQEAKDRQRAENVDGADIVIYSAAIAKSNPERMRAEELGIPQMERATLLGQPGKLVKVSGGSMQTHSQYGDGRRETLIAHLALMGAPVELLEFVRQSVTLDGCISPIYDAGFDAVWTHLADAAAAYAAARIHGEMRVDAVMLDAKGQILGRSTSL